MQFLNLVNLTDKQLGIISENQRVRVASRIKGAHVVDLLEVDIREDELIVARVDDRRSIGAGKDVTVRCGRVGFENLQLRWLCSQNDLFPLRESARFIVEDVVEKCTITNSSEEVTG